MEKLLQGVSGSKPARQYMAALHPAEHPGNSAHILQPTALAAARRRSTDSRILELFHGGSLLGVGQDIRVIVDTVTIVCKSVRGHRRHAIRPFRFTHGATTSGTG